MLKKTDQNRLSHMNETPYGYRGARSRIEIWAVKSLFRLFGLDKHIEVVFQAPPETIEGEKPFVLMAPDFWATLKIVFDPEFQVGETYVDGKWFLKKGELTDFFATLFGGPKSGFYKYFRLSSKIYSAAFLARQYFFPIASTRKSAHHYDEDHELYSNILDDDFLYTCAFFDSPGSTLADAQQNKLQTIVKRLSTGNQPTEILDIGCGWGGLSRAIAKTLEKSTVTGISISPRQLDWAKTLTNAKLSKSDSQRISFEFSDYITHFDTYQKTYDAVSVVGMMEHVGSTHHSLFLSKISQLLKPGGKAVIHTITCPESGRTTNRWVDRYIFPGGYAPSNNEVKNAATSTNLRMVTEKIYPGRHYQTTIRHWKNNFLLNFNTIRRALSLAHNEFETERLMRQWFFYLSTLENMFDENLLKYTVTHFVFEKPPID